MKIIQRVGVYARVSTAGQETENQLIELRRYVEARQWVAIEYVDKGFSGAKTESERPALKSMMQAARQRQLDAVIVWDFSRFARSMRQLVDAMDTFQALGISFISIREGVDTTTPNGRLVFGIFASLAQFERELIRERVMLGLQKSRAKGRKPGPKRNSVDIEGLIAKTAQGLSLRQMAGLYGVSKDTISNLLKRHSKSVEDGIPKTSPAS